MMDRDDKAPRTPISLLDYLEQRGWKKLRDNGGDEVLGLCPLHLESIPSFYVNRRKQAFYCHGCDRGGGLARLIDLLEGRPEPAEGFRPPKQLMEQTYCFYQRQLARNEACAYLTGRGIHDLEVIQRMRIGYAPGTCLRGYLTRLGYSHDAMRNRRLVDSGGRDCLFRCLPFPLPECGNLYGRSLFPHGLCRHRFLPGSKGGLYGWNQAMAFPRVMVVEGLFDAAALWQAGFPQSVAALGSHLNDRQRTLPGWDRLPYICFDADRNGSGQRAARRLSIQLRHAGVEALRVELPDGHDPASFFAAGARAADFQRCLDRARP